MDRVVVLLSGYKDPCSSSMGGEGTEFDRDYDDRERPKYRALQVPVQSWHARDAASHHQLLHHLPRIEWIPRSAHSLIVCVN
jgi:hypothetical protein